MALEFSVKTMNEVNAKINLFMKIIASINKIRWYHEILAIRPIC